MKKVKIDNIYKQMKIELSDFNKMSDQEQYGKLEDTLKKMYENKVEVSKPHILKCIKLTVSKEDDYLYLANNLTVEKNPKELLFYFKKRTSKIPILILLISTLLIGVFSATYSGLLYLELNQLDIDIDGDGIADINIDLNNDRTPDINIDTNGDSIPDLDIDYKGNREPIFNLDKDGDGEPDFNIVNDGTDPEKCTVNCDANGDGWPDYNYDIDGDGKPDLDIDSNQDGIIDTGIDINGDLVCDVMCDDDNDGVCDRACYEYEGEDSTIPSGPSDVTGNQDNNINSGQLSVVYEEDGELLIEGLLPDDHPEGQDYPYKNFSITNLSNFEVTYKITFVINKNTFTSQNFEYKIDSNNGGFESEFQTAPWEDTLLSSYVVIPANGKQEYTITFRIKGTNQEQNYDQGKSFDGYIKIGA